MELQNVFTINKDIQSAWKVLSNDFSDVANWSAQVSHSTGTTDSAVGAVVGDSRSCSTNFGKTTETVNVVDIENSTILFDIVSEKMPSAVKNVTSRWSLRRLSDTSTELTILGTLEIAFPLSLILNPMIKMKMNPQLQQLGEDFVVYVESDGKSVSAAKEKSRK